MEGWLRRSGGLVAIAALSLISLQAAAQGKSGVKGQATVSVGGPNVPDAAKKAGEKAGNAVDKAGNAAGNAADKAGNAVDKAGNAAGNAADKAGNAADKAGNAAGNAAATAGANAGSAGVNAGANAGGDDKDDHKGHKPDKAEDKGKGASGKGAAAKSDKEALRAKVNAALKGQPMTNAMREELRRHARRLARLDRVKEVARTANDTAATARADGLIAKENARHDKWMANFDAKAEAAGGVK